MKVVNFPPTSPSQPLTLLSRGTETHTGLPYRERKTHTHTHTATQPTQTSANTDTHAKSGLFSSWQRTLFPSRPSLTL